MRGIYSLLILARHIDDRLEIHVSMFLSVVILPDEKSVYVFSLRRIQILGLYEGMCEYINEIDFKVRALRSPANDIFKS